MCPAVKSRRLPHFPIPLDDAVLFKQNWLKCTGSRSNSNKRRKKSVKCVSETYTVGMPMKCPSVVSCDSRVIAHIMQSSSCDVQSRTLDLYAVVVV